MASARPLTTCGLGPTFHPRYARHTLEEAPELLRAVLTPLLMLIEMLVTWPQAFNCAADTVGVISAFPGVRLS